MATASVEDVGPCKKLLKVVVPEEQVRAKIEEQYEKLRESVDLPGFRRGRAPRTLLEKRFGEDLLSEVKEELMAEAGQQALDENGLTLIGEPSYDNIDFDGAELAFEVSVETKPEFDLPDYKNLKLKKSASEVTEEDVQEALERLRRQRATLQPVSEGEVQKDDLLVIDWTAWCEGEQVASQDGTTVELDTRSLGGIVVNDFGEKLRGASKGETREIEVEFPEDHPVESCRGKKGVAKVTVADIRRPLLPEIDDEFAKSLDFDSLEDLKDLARKQLADRKEREARADLERQAIDQLLDSVEMELPEGVVKRQTRDYLARQHMRLAQQGVPEDEIEEELNKLQGRSEEAVERELRTYFVLEKIADKEKIFVTEDEVNARIDQMAASFRATRSQMMKHLSEEGRLTELRRQMREEKVVETILSNAEIQDAT